MQKVLSLVSNLNSKINKLFYNKKSFLIVLLLALLIIFSSLMRQEIYRQSSTNWQEGWSAWKVGNFEKALVHWSQNPLTSKYAPRPARLYYWRIRALDELGRNDEANELRLKLSKRFPADFYTFLLFPNGGNSLADKNFLQKKAQLFYPRAWEEEVSLASNATGISKKTIWSVMKQESKFRNSAVSKSGAIGLMQLMPTTANNVAKQMEIEANNIYEAADNIMLGATYYAMLNKKFRGDLIRVTAAYNAGETVVIEWDTLYAKDWAEWVENIPYSETREFVRSVLENREVYRIIYDSEEYKPLCEFVNKPVIPTSSYTASNKFQLTNKEEN